MELLGSYLTQVSDLDLAPDPEQFVASPPMPRWPYILLISIPKKTLPFGSGYPVSTTQTIRMKFSMK